MSYCINPSCPHPQDSTLTDQVVCPHCGSSLVLLGRYRVISLLSTNSGFAVIYEVEDGTTRKILKTLQTRHNESKKAVELFKQEAAVLGQLDHPGIPQIDPPGYFQFFPKNSSEPIHCFVMEKIDGPTLYDWMLQQGHLLISEQQAIAWLEQIAQILHLVHQKNYFHRDIKLQNIMLRSTGQLVLIDFGTAREMTYTYLAQIGSSGNITRISSAGYTPPEQEKGHAVPQSDFYALGRTFVYLLTGRKLTDTDIYNPFTDEFCWREKASDISPQFANFIDHLMAHRAIDRPKDTQEILDTLREIKKHLADPATTATTLRLPATKIQFSPDSPTLPEYKPPRKIPKIWWGLGLIGLTLLGGYGIWEGYHYLTLESSPPEVVQEVATAKSFQGHQSLVNAIAISHNNQILVSASEDQTLKVWDLNRGELLKTLTGHTSAVRDVVLSDDGQFVISASSDRTIRIWDLNTGEVRHNLTGHASFVNHVILSQDQQILVSIGTDRTLRIWGVETGENLHTLTGHTSFINDMLISSDGTQLISASADRTLKIWDIATGELLHNLVGHASFVNRLTLSPDGQFVASASADRTVKIWNITTGELQKTLSGHTSFVNDVVISPDGKLVATASADKSIKVWNFATGEEQYTLDGHANYVNRLAITQDGQTLISSSADQTIRLWDLSTGEVKRVLSGHNAPINDFALSRDERYIGTGSESSQIMVWTINRE